MSAFSVDRVRQRELGMSPKIGDGDALARSLYSTMKPVASWDPFQLSGSQVYGGIFNLEFSPGGSLLVAACEKKSVLIFDPLTHERIHTVNDAHSDCVNCVKFLDGRMFATCSDDTTIALWDVRNLKKKIRTLSGHSNWVKNIEYSVKDNLLVTSGLDGSIYTWDINSYTEWSLVYQRVFHASGLMRCRISPDASQMVMCTTGGLLVIIHDLNLSTLARDLQGFKPNLYRLMQMSQQLIPIAACYDHLFDSKRHENRVEFVTDFPEGNDAEVVSSLQIHPQGWSALSRNISHDDRSEWTCIHDIQPDPTPSDKSVVDGDEEDAPPPPAMPPQRTLRCTLWRLHGPHSHRHDHQRSGRSERSSRSSRSSGGGGGGGSSGGGGGGSGGGGGGAGADAGPSGSGAGSSREAPAAGASGSAGAGAGAGESGSRGQNVGIQNDVWEASITIKQHRTLQEMARRGQVGRNFNMQRIMGINTGISPPAEPPRRRARSRANTSPAANTRSSASPAASDSERDRDRDRSDRSRPSGSSIVRVRYLDPDPDESDEPMPPESDPPVRVIRQNKKRLLYYTQETNEGKGFIKELCYSSDGRLVCSPFGYGVRLLALNNECSELSHCIEEGARPKSLVEVGQSAGHHPDLVVSSKFSPRHYLLVSGCLAGKIVWYQPVG